MKRCAPHCQESICDLHSAMAARHRRGELGLSIRHVQSV